MRASEWIVLAYFGYLAATAVGRPVSFTRRRRVLTVGLLVGLAVVVVARLGGPWAATMRDWAPLAYLITAYWLPASLVVEPNRELERTLLALDERWLGEGLTRFAERAPMVVLELLELAYLCCYPMVPLGFACLWAAGLREEADGFWTAVLLATCASYGALPWLPTRPPRAVDTRDVPARSRIRHLNLALLDRASVQLNTFPSGHAAAAVATALAVGAHLRPAGLVLGLVALGILAGSVLGRYHYGVDALAGAALGLCGFAASRLV